MNVFVRTLFAAAVVAIAAPATAGWSLGVEPHVGARRLDDRLADYRWSVEPIRVAGLDVTARNGRWSLAFGHTRSGTEQATGLEGLSAPRVDLGEWTVRGDVEIVRWADARLRMGAAVGRLNLSWSPDRLRFDVQGTEIEVDFAPIDTWTRALEMSADWAASPAFALGLRLRAVHFDLQTAHRNGDAVENLDETFGALDATVFVRIVPWHHPDVRESS